MKSYQLTYIISSDMGSQEQDAVKQGIESFAQDNGAVVLKSEKTIAQILAYPVKKKTSGCFITLDFQAPEETIKGLSQKVKKENAVLRHTIVVKRPVKQKKLRRTKKPLLQDVKSPAAKTSKVEIEDIEKKLDQMLSE